MTKELNFCGKIYFFISSQTSLGCVEIVNVLFPLRPSGAQLFNVCFQ